MPAWAGGRRAAAFRPRRLLFPALALCGALAAFLASPEPRPGLDRTPLAGPVQRVVDGDTLDLGGRRIRLDGIDAPEYDQSCGLGDGTPWPCGAEATGLLGQLATAGPLACQPVVLDRYGRTVARCKDETGRDLGDGMVRSGLAVADGGYASAEAEARAAGRGIWRGAFERPAEWRRQKQDDIVVAPSRAEAILRALGAWPWS